MRMVKIMREREREINERGERQEERQWEKGREKEINEREERDRKRDNEKGEERKTNKKTPCLSRRFSSRTIFFEFFSLFDQSKFMSFIDLSKFRAFD